MRAPCTYDKLAVIPIRATTEDCVVGWEGVIRRLSERRPRILCIECYPGVHVEDIKRSLASVFQPCQIFRSADFLKSPGEVEELVATYLTDDPVFGRMNGLGVGDFLDPTKLALGQEQIRKSEGRVLVVGTGATLLAPEADVLVYADLSRWEIQQRQRRNEVPNLGANNRNERASLKYKRAFFVDWRAADRLKKQAFPKIDFLLDTHDQTAPKLIPGEAIRQALRSVVARPFRVAPFFDPGPWGGEWMRKMCDLPAEAPNYAWCFDCVPEENSLRLGFGTTVVEVPALDLVFFEPRRLLGEAVHARFGTEFPIRFDFLDTMDGGNLSLQVHPLTEYIQDQFGMNYTQDESYYVLDAKGGAGVFLGLQERVNPAEMREALERAQQGNCPFPAERFVNRWPAKKHDHFLIPAGTVHCSGKNCMVLEISATPYIFTFKLWDWDRLDLDGRPRPVHLEHGIRNIQWDRTTEWVRLNLLNRIELIAEGEGSREERTGLHEREFIETRRHWFNEKVWHHTQGGVNVLNLVEGPEVVVESPDQAFEPFMVHYAETFIVPAAVGRYTIRPSKPGRCATIKAYVRTSP
ncbi:MAG TPA: class I mannose-6-phosphate isomerase [Candidatus Limnocylindrales bacterium]|nr:class I mannose-6-phosphate isomerase [Candidatus Limnocylindrales bacterium]